MAQHFVSEGELGLMCQELKAHPPMLLSRWAVLTAYFLGPNHLVFRATPSDVYT